MLGKLCFYERDQKLKLRFRERKIEWKERMAMCVFIFIFIFMAMRLYLSSFRRKYDAVQCIVYCVNGFGIFSVFDASVLGEWLVLYIDSFKVCLDMHKMKNLNSSLRNMRFELTVQMISDFCLWEENSHYTDWRWAVKWVRLVHVSWVVCVVSCDIECKLSKPEMSNACRKKWALLFVCQQPTSPYFLHFHSSCWLQNRFPQSVFICVRENLKFG